MTDIYNEIMLEREEETASRAEETLSPFWATINERVNKLYAAKRERSEELPDTWFAEDL